MIFQLSGLKYLGALLLASSVAALGGCGQGTGDEGSVRFVNASTSTAALDLYAGDDRPFASVSAKGSTGFTDIEDGSYSFKVTTTGSTSALASLSVSVSKDTKNTLVAWGTDTSMKLSSLPDTDAEPSSGYAKVRVLNTTGDSTKLDVFLTSSAEVIDGIAATVSSAVSGTLTGFTTLARGTYRLRVAATDDRSDLRLDLASYTLPDKGRVTILIVPASGGYLVDMIGVQEDGEIAAQNNTNARVRLVAGQQGGGAVTATVGGTTVATGARSPSVGSYTWVTAGEGTLSATVDGAAIAQQTATFTAGADYTLLVHGSTSAFGAALLTDDNRLISNSSKSRMRLVNGMAGSDGGLSLTLDYSAVANSVGYATASSYASVTPTSSSRLEVYSPLQTSALWTATDTSLASGATYTVFALETQSSPSVVLRRDR